MVDIIQTLENIQLWNNKRTGIEVSKEEFNKIISTIDRENIDFLLEKIKNNLQQPAGVVVMIVGGKVNYPHLEKHKDIDIKFSMKLGHSAQPVLDVLNTLIESPEIQDRFQISKLSENTLIKDSGISETYNLNPKNGGTLLELIPPYGAEDLPAEYEMTFNRNKHRRYYIYASL